MVVLSLSIRFWKDGDIFWAEAPWLTEPVSGSSWEDVYEKARYGRTPIEETPAE